MRPRTRKPARWNSFLATEGGTALHGYDFVSVTAGCTGWNWLPAVAGTKLVLPAGLLARGPLADSGGFPVTGRLWMSSPSLVTRIPATLRSGVAEVTGTGEPDDQGRLDTDAVSLAFYRPAQGSQIAPDVPGASGLPAKAAAAGDLRGGDGQIIGRWSLERSRWPLIDRLKVFGGFSLFAELQKVAHFLH